MREQPRQAVTGCFISPENKYYDELLVAFNKIKNLFVEYVETLALKQNYLEQQINRERQILITKSGKFIWSEIVQIFIENELLSFME